MDPQPVIPTIACKGLCHYTCGPVAVTFDELQTMRAAAGVDLPANIVQGYCMLEPKEEALECRCLTEEKRCSIYEHRPMICRLWGVAEGLECEHGCEATGAVSREEAKKLLKRGWKA